MKRREEVELVDHKLPCADILEFDSQIYLKGFISEIWPYLLTTESLDSFCLPEDAPAVGVIGLHVVAIIVHYSNTYMLVKLPNHAMSHVPGSMHARPQYRMYIR